MSYFFVNRRYSKKCKFGPLRDFRVFVLWGWSQVVKWDIVRLVSVSRVQPYMICGGGVYIRRDRAGGHPKLASGWSRVVKCGIVGRVSVT